MGSIWTLANLADVKVTDKYLDEAFHIDVKNLLALDADRFLAGFRETACLIKGETVENTKVFMKSKSRYEGEWEDKLLGGHTMGHYMTAIAQAVVNPAATSDEKTRLKERLDYLVDSLKECQSKVAGTGQDGYIFGAGFPKPEFRENVFLQFDNVEKGLGHPIDEAWVPWYTMHKILTGLNAAYKLAGNETALEVANSLGVWIANRTDTWDEETRKKVLGIEYGGINDCLYELYQINRELKEKESPLAYPEYERFEIAAHRFDEEELFDKILKGGKDLLDNTHANTTIPKFCGALSRYEAFPMEKRYLQYAESFWDLVVSQHTYVTGGNSENEHFGKDGILNAERTNVNNETCNTYNMLKLSRRLFAATGNIKYLEYSARTFTNAIVASQNHENGFTTYFQPMATGYHKVFNTFDGNFWCCTGTGYENFTKLQSGIYFKGKDKLSIGLFVSSEYETKNYTVSMDCDFTRSGDVTIELTPRTGKKISDDLCLRVPAWSKDSVEVLVDGSKIDAIQSEGFLTIPSSFLSEGATITYKLSVGLYAESLPDGPNTYAFLYGPFLLSARLGTDKISTRPHGIAVVVSAEKAVDDDRIKVLSESSVKDFIKYLDKHLVKRPDQMEFDLKGCDKELVFTTHYDQYKESYGIYWTLL